MPDTGFNSYLSIAPDGTVVVPNNIDVAGVVTAGDLVTHPELAAALATAEAYADDGDATLQGNLDALSGDVVHGAGYTVSQQYNLDFNVAGGNETTFTGSVDVFEIPDLAWTEYTVLGYMFATSGNAHFSHAELAGTQTLVMTFVSDSAGIQSFIGTFYFVVIGRP